MSDIDDQEPIEYLSYNGLGRAPMVWGVPFMAGLGIVCACLLPSMMLGVFVSPYGWFFAVSAVPLLIFARIQCETDDRALTKIAKEVKWALIKWMSGNAGIFGGTFTIAPTSYTRKLRNVESAIKAAVRR
ncbi:MAG: VirB3 family type IV secretion system protein [Azoarcus sp.]|jgi:type IV secretion system protein VirB3|nr:VirB3 family type IV secretion system protein [Azoarcus sp.]